MKTYFFKIFSVPNDYQALALELYTACVDNNILEVRKLLAHKQLNLFINVLSQNGEDALFAAAKSGMIQYSY
jgi:hypothetical protein